MNTITPAAKTAKLSNKMKVGISPPEKVQPSEKYLHAYRVSTPMKKKYASSQEAAYDANTSPAIFNFAISIVLGLVA